MTYVPYEPLYVQLMEQIIDLEEPHMNINASHVKAFHEDLYRQLICYPQEVMNDMFFEKFPDTIFKCDNHALSRF